ncbi:MAG: hypothetical protein R6X31_01540 [Anaerolineae bacterium]
MNTRRLATLLLLALAAAACGSGAEPVPDAGTSSPSLVPTAEESPLSPPATPPLNRSEEGESPIAPPSEGTAQVIAAAKARLASELDASVEAIEVVAIEPVEWPDASLGCRQPGQAYAQVVTPGYRVRLRLGERQYEVHTDRSGQTAVMCGQRLERGPAAAVAHLADEIGVSQEEIEVVSVEPVEWPDASLGCPEPGKMYAQVITPGYRIILELEGDRFEVHTDQEGRSVVTCEAER